MSQTIDNAPKDGDFVRYVEQLEKEQLKSTAVMMQQAQARSPGEVRPAASGMGGKTAAGVPKLTMAQAQKAAEILSKGNTSGAGSTDMNPLVQRLVTRFGMFIAIMIGVVILSKITDIPVWIAVPVVLGIWASYVKKSKAKD